MKEAALIDEPLSQGTAPVSAGEAEPLYTREFWLVFSAHFALNSVANLFVLFPLFIVRLGASAQTLGAIVGTGSLAALLARPVFSSTIDRRGRRYVALRFLLLEIVALSLYLPLHSLGPAIFVVRAVHGATEGVARVALFAMVYELLPQSRRGEGMATFSLCGMLPGAVAPLLGEELIKRSGFGPFFVAAMALASISLVATWLLPAERVDHRGHVTSSLPGRAGLRAVFFDSHLLPLWIVTFLFALGISSRLSFVAPYAYLKGINRVAWYFVIYSGVAVVLRMFSGRMMDRIGLERMVVPSLVTLAIGLAMLSLTGRYGMLEIAGLVGGIGHGYLYPVLSALVIGRTETGAMGSSSAIYTSLYDLGAMVGPYVLGTVASYLGYSVMFNVAGLFALSAAVYFLLVEPRLHSRL